MIIAKDSVVRFHYRLSDADDAEIQSSFHGEAATALIGASNIIPGVEQALLGLEAGATTDVEVTPEQGYGVHDPNGVQRLPKKYFTDPNRLRPGMSTVIKTAQGHLAVTVLKVGMSVIDVDTNHPLAGKTLKFHLQVEEVREATAEELQHQHVHGPGGHQH